MVPGRLRSKRGQLFSSRARYSQKHSTYNFGVYTTHAPCAPGGSITDSGCDKFKGPLPAVQTINLLWKHARLLFHLSTCLSAPQSTILGPNPAGSNSMGGGAGAAGCDGSPPPLGIPGRPGRHQDAFPAAVPTYTDKLGCLSSANTGINMPVKTPSGSRACTYMIVAFTAKEHLSNILFVKYLNLLGQSSNKHLAKPAKSSYIVQMGQTIPTSR